MHCASILATAAALASIGSAAVLPRDMAVDPGDTAVDPRDVTVDPREDADIAADAYVGDVRTFTAFGCDAQNQGVGTFTHSMTNSCNIYAESFGSLYIHIKPGWEFRAHMSNTCSDPGTVIAKTIPGGVPAIVCNNQSVDNGPWVAYSVYPSTS
ncbi:Ribonuclease T2 precursor (RNase T2) [Hypoxylon texense]